VAALPVLSFATVPRNEECGLFVWIARITKKRPRLMPDLDRIIPKTAIDRFRCYSEKWQRCHLMARHDQSIATVKAAMIRQMGRK
jgi:hypothetical protein